MQLKGLGDSPLMKKTSMQPIFYAVAKFNAVLDWHCMHACMFVAVIKFVLQLRQPQHLILALPDLGV